MTSYCIVHGQDGSRQPEPDAPKQCFHIGTGVSIFKGSPVSAPSLPSITQFPDSRKKLRQHVCSQIHHSRALVYHISRGPDCKLHPREVGFQICQLHYSFSQIHNRHHNRGSATLGSTVFGHDRSGRAYRQATRRFDLMTARLPCAQLR